jgi:hypothetical protein
VSDHDDKSSQAVSIQCPHNREPTSLAKHNRTVLLETLVKNEAQVRPLEEFCEQGFTRLDWLAPQILPVKLQQVERAKHSAL